jgi:hypothetical protein
MIRCVSPGGIIVRERHVSFGRAESCANDRWVNRVMPETNNTVPTPARTSLRRLLVSSLHTISVCVSPLFLIPFALCLLLSTSYVTSLQYNVLSVQLLSTLLCTQDDALDDEDSLCFAGEHQIAMS